MFWIVAREEPGYTIGMVGGEEETEQLNLERQRPGQQRRRRYAVEVDKGKPLHRRCSGPNEKHITSRNEFKRPIFPRGGFDVSFKMTQARRISLMKYPN